MAIEWKLYCDECDTEINGDVENTLDEMLLMIKKSLRAYEREKDGKCVCDKCKQEYRPFQLSNY